MKQSREILNLAKQNNGIVTTAMVVSSGLSRGSLKYLAEKGSLEHVSRGVYTMPEAWEDEFVNLQSRYKKGIFSLDTALFLWDLTDRTPGKYHMTFPSTYNLSGAKKERILCHQQKIEYYHLGIVNAVTPCGNRVRAYNAERTLCDILRTVNHADVQIIAEAFKRYVVKKDKNIPLLSEYAKELKVEKRLRAYLEVLL
ncbi:MAG: type IV toxin-antitoxin system AbiEi family antitoxin domain-containing protein [Lachnospiraceae bacterium]